MIETALEEIRSKLDVMYSLTLEMIEICLDSYEETIRREEEVNRIEVEIDELIVQSIALYQPEASNLRELLMDLKINNDIERVADHAENVARDMRALREKGVNLGEFQEDLKIIRELARKSFVEVYSAYKNLDPELAFQIIKSDNVVDEFRDRVLNKAVKSLETEVALKVVSIAQNFERIADLSTNIAEDIVFITKGQIVKHKRNLQP